MRIGILTFLAFFVMCGVSYAGDVYITQSGASLTANINQDGQTNRFGVSGTVVTLTGDNQTLDIDQIGNSNIIAASVIGATQELTLRQTGNSNTSTVTVGSNSAAASNSIIQALTGNSNTTTINVGTAAASRAVSLNGMIGALDNRVKTINNEIVRLDTLICHALGVKPDTRRLSAADGKEDTRKD